MTVDLSPDPEVIQAAGGILWKRSGGRPKVAVIHRPKHSDWSLPKGKLEAGESWVAAAVREVREETGCEVKLLEFAGVISYMVGGRPKVVLFWNMNYVGGEPFQASKEVDELQWLSRSEALSRLNHPAERKLLDENRSP